MNTRKSPRRTAAISECSSASSLTAGGSLAAPSNQVDQDEMDSLQTRMAQTALHNQPLAQEDTFVSEEESMFMDSDDEEEYDSAADDASDCTDMDMEINYLEYVVRQLSEAKNTPARTNHPQYSMPQLADSSIPHSVGGQESDFHRVTPTYPTSLAFPDQQASAPAAFAPDYYYRPAAVYSTIPASGVMHAPPPMYPWSYGAGMSSNGPVYHDYFGQQQQEVYHMGSDNVSQQLATNGNYYHGSGPASVSDGSENSHMRSESFMADEMLGLVDTLGNYMSDLDGMMGGGPPPF
ncbi:hypothetical protein MPSEU_000971200 [Mayamaea pseudoterrestris]|nr:hypothetical protein MPSEU_000971200 [Mayamaea pseudoterrestris]